MNLENYLINFDELFKNRIRSIRIWPANQAETLRKAGYIWFRIPEPGSGEENLAVVNSWEYEKGWITEMTFAKSDIIFRHGTEEHIENSRCITSEDYQAGCRLNLSKLWDDVVCEYLKKINKLQHIDKRFQKLKTENLQWTKKLQRELRKI